MPGKKSKGKQFIDKFEGTTFVLAPRSQRDPNTNCDSAPQHVLWEQKRKGDSKNKEVEPKKYGIHNDDNYDYLQHLRDAGDLNNVGLEESFGRRKAEAASSGGFRVIRDSDDTAALEEDLDFENPDDELEDDFVQRGNKRKRKEDDKEKRRALQIKYGVYFEDDYNYCQHLRAVGDLDKVDPESSFRVGRSGAEVAAVVAGRKDLGASKKMVLPSSVFESTVQMKVGLLNKAVKQIGAQPDVDPEIIAALDDDFDYDNPDNQLEDNFMELLEEAADDEASEDEEDWETSSEPGYGDNEDMFDEEETKSRFTAHSMTSAVTKRSEGLTRLDEQFEKFYEEYDEDQIGVLTHEETIAPIDPIDFNSPLDYAAHVQMKKIEDDNRRYTLRDIVEKGGPVHPKYYRESQDDGQLETMFVDKPVERFDCESIRSTRSTLYNHPTTIDNPLKNQNRPNVIGLTKTDKSQRSVEPTEKEDWSTGSETDDSEVQTINTFRAKDETPEERKARKQEVKEHRRMKREEKSSMRKAYKDERTRLHKEVINLKSNLQSVQIV